MKLRLHITTPEGPGFTFEHPGPIVRIGRDPEGELALEGRSSQGVSWNHARIELTPRGAHVTDLGSTNGTRRNGAVISGRTLLRPGDRLNLSQNGPTLEVVELSLPYAETPVTSPLPHLPQEPPAEKTRAARAEEPASAPSRGKLLAGIGAGAVAALAVVLGVLVWMGGSPDQGPGPEDQAAELGGETASVPRRVTSGGNDQGSAPWVLPPLPPRPAEGSLPASELREVGTYVAPAAAPPSVLLERQQDPDPWGRLRPDARVRTGYYLVSLPGYRSLLQLDSGVELMLWGNLPEFSPVPPVLESAVMLHAPDPGLALDFTLDRGRVRLSSPGRAARVRVRFHRQTWDLTLPRPGAEVVLELWGFHTPADRGEAPSGRRLLACLGLFARGSVSVRTAERTIDIPDGVHQLVWSSGSGDVVGPKALEQPPAWWTDRLDPRASPHVGDMMVALTDFSGHLRADRAALDVLLTQVRESGDAPLRALGVLLLGALDALPHVIGFLEERQHLEVRAAAGLALRHWMSRSSDHAVEIERLLRAAGYAPEKAAILVRLLHGFSADEADRPETYTQLIGYLEHANLAIRELALLNLASLAPETAGKVDYDPTADADSRRRAAARWRELIPPGQVPRRDEG